MFSSIYRDMAWPIYPVYMLEWSRMFIIQYHVKDYFYYGENLTHISIADESRIKFFVVLIKNLLLSYSIIISFLLFTPCPWLSFTLSKYIKEDDSKYVNSTKNIKYLPPLLDSSLKSQTKNCMLQDIPPDRGISKHSTTLPLPLLLLHGSTSAAAVILTLLLYYQLLLSPLENILDWLSRVWS